ncbi:HK97 family phage portal protein [Sporomusaceae bacterium BoRhaA]|uniref:phage portal protein n=1 Tax=Pelorhabdus rhamnosifermentans TaxID=2772457 RepID=UPI001FE39A07|nr:phage portal protein [Pelorhabdus rhamnosifermentans]MBU2703885.1 HK97 family phage portal protein [Pelorhabdus rhamnosifermentans]
MNILKKVTGFFNRSPTVVRYELITDRGNGFYSWNGNLYKSDIIRSCIRPFYKAVGKLLAKQIRQTGTDLKINPDLYVQVLLEEPNPYMTGQMLQEKLATQFKLNNNAFAYINRDDFGYATEIYPIPAVAVEAIYDKDYMLYLKFTFANGRTATFAYADVIHLRQDYNSNDIFGDGNTEVLTGLMEIVITIDQGIVKAIKNSAVIKWLMKFKTTIRPEDIQAQTKKFVDNFLKIDANDDASVGVAGTDTKADVEQVKPTDYVPNASQMDKTVQRIYNYFGTNEDIIQSKFDEDGWNSYFEAEIEPFSMQLSNEFSRKIFSRRERSFGNRIIFEANSLQYASMATKLNLLQMVDRSALTPNEWRLVMNMGPIPGGDVAIRRLDTAVVTAQLSELKEVVNKLAVIVNKGGDTNNAQNTN